MATDPTIIRPDSVLLQQLQDDPRYDYSRDVLQVEQENVQDWLFRHIDQWLDNLFSSEPMEALGEWFWPLMAVVLLLIIFGFLYWRHRSLFGSQGTVDDSIHDDEEDTIYGIDFPSAIATARSRRQWYEAVRLTYLQTLKVLSDTGRIDWRTYKTPTQYLHEVTTDDFRTFTGHFLRVRYGGFMADEALCNEMAALGQRIEKGGTA